MPGEALSNCAGSSAILLHAFSRQVPRDVQEFPPSQRPQSFGIDQIVEGMERSFEAAARMQ
jgi:hypothetical protein